MMGVYNLIANYNVAVGLRRENVHHWGSAVIAHRTKKIIRSTIAVNSVPSKVTMYFMIDVI